MSHETRDHGGTASLQIAATEEIAAARRLATNAASVALGDLRAGDVALVTSELVTNALEHGGRPPVDVIIAASDESLTVEVVSELVAASGAELERSQRWPAVTEARGRGLQIAEALSDELEISGRAGGRVSVSARFDRN